MQFLVFCLCCLFVCLYCYCCLYYDCIIIVVCIVIVVCINLFVCFTCVHAYAYHSNCRMTATKKISVDHREGLPPLLVVVPNQMQNHVTDHSRRTALLIKTTTLACGMFLSFVLCVCLCDFAILFVVLCMLLLLLLSL